MGKAEDRIAAIETKLTLPPQVWKRELSEHMGDQRFLLDALKELSKALAFYGQAPEASILYWDENSQKWVDDSGEKARAAFAQIEDIAENR